jgi:hypothetical protein
MEDKGKKEEEERDDICLWDAIIFHEHDGTLIVSW